MTQSPQLLLADGNLSLLKPLALLLTGEGYTVTTAASWKDVLASVERESFSCIITDDFAGPGDGLRLVHPLREVAYPTPVGLTSGWPLTQDEVLHAGFAFYLAKPFSIDDLFSCVAACIA